MPAETGTRYVRSRGGTSKSVQVTVPADVHERVEEIRQEKLAEGIRISYSAALASLARRGFYRKTV